MAAGGGDPLTPSSSIYYSRQKKSCVHNCSVYTPRVAICSSGHALPDANRIHSLGFANATKDWENICQRKVQLINFLSSLERSSGNSVIAGKMAGGKSTNSSMVPAEPKEKADIIVHDSDDEDGNSSGYNKLVPETNKEPTTSELVGNVTKWGASYEMSQTFEAIQAQGDKNMQIVPYGQSAALVNQSPLQTSWQPSIQFERVAAEEA